MPQWFQRPITKYKCVLRRLCLPESNPHRQLLHWFFFLSQNLTKQNIEYTYANTSSLTNTSGYNIAQDSTISVFSGGKTIQLHSSDHSWMYSYNITNLRIPFSFIFSPDTNGYISRYTAYIIIHKIPILIIKLQFLLSSSWYIQLCIYYISSSKKYIQTLQFIQQWIKKKNFAYKRRSMFPPTFHTLNILV